MFHISLIRFQDMLVAAGTVGAFYYLKPGAFNDAAMEPGKAFLVVWGVSLGTHIAIQKLGLGHLMGA